MALVAGFIILITITGNLLVRMVIGRSKKDFESSRKYCQVIFSFKIDREVRTSSKYFYLSLAVADLIVGCFSMPIFAVEYIEKHWPFNRLTILSKARPWTEGS